MGKRLELGDGPVGRDEEQFAGIDFYQRVGIVPGQGAGFFKITRQGFSRFVMLHDAASTQVQRMHLIRRSQKAFAHNAQRYLREGCIAKLGLNGGE